MFVATELTSHSTKETVSTAYLVSFKITFAFKYKYNLMHGDMTGESWKILLHFHSFSNEYNYSYRFTLFIESYDAFCYYMVSTLLWTRQTILILSKQGIRQLWDFIDTKFYTPKAHCLTKCAAHKLHLIKCYRINNCRWGGNFSDHLSQGFSILTMHHNHFWGLKMHRCLGLSIPRILF